MLRTLAALLTCAFALASHAAWPAAVMPTVPAESLAGKHFSVPIDLPNVPCVLIVGFSKRSRAQTEQWSRRLEGIAAPDAFKAYSVSVIESVPTFLRGFVTGSIRRDVPARLHDRFLIVSQQSTGWKEVTAYKEPDVAYVVLINRGREIVWRTMGPLTEPSIQALTKEIAKINEVQPR